MAPSNANATRRRESLSGRKARQNNLQQEKPAQEPVKETAKEEPAKEEDVLPSWRVREINEERRRVQAENEQMRVELAKLQARQAQDRS